MILAIHAFVLINFSTRNVTEYIFLILPKQQMETEKRCGRDVGQLAGLDMDDISVRTLLGSGMWIGGFSIRK